MARTNIEGPVFLNTVLVAIGLNKVASEIAHGLGIKENTVISRYRGMQEAFANQTPPVLLPELKTGKTKGRKTDMNALLAVAAAAGIQPVPAETLAKIEANENGEVAATPATETVPEVSTETVAEVTPDAVSGLAATLAGMTVGDVLAAK